MEALRRRSAAEQTRWSDLFDTPALVKLVILGIVFYMTFNVELQRCVAIWQKDPTWSHGFLIPLFSLYLIHQRRYDLAQTPSRRSILGVIGLILCVLFYLVSIYPLQIGYFQRVAMLGALFAMTLAMVGWKRMAILAVPVLYLFFALPLPGRIYDQATMPLRILASKVAAPVLSLWPELEATASNVVIEVVYKGEVLQPGLNVADACAGMRLLVAFCALGVAMAYLSPRRLWQRVVMVISTLPIAVFCNILRVVITGYIYVLIDPMYAKGMYHTGLGLAMLPVAFGLYWLLGSILRNIFIEDDSEDSDDTDQTSGASSKASPTEGTQ